MEQSLMRHEPKPRSALPLALMRDLGLLAVL